MRKFDSNVQILKYKVLREVARHTWEGNDIFSMFNEIAKEVVRKDHIPMRCCIYKDRAIVAERIRIALGGNKKQPGVVEVIDIACDDCPQVGYMVTDMCRGCIAHQCQGACPKEAIEFDEHLKAHIDKKKCIECGQCARVCPYVDNVPGCVLITQLIISAGFVKPLVRREPFIWRKPVKRRLTMKNAPVVVLVSVNVPLARR